ncbi:MAG: hypothetical protein Q8912_06275 [Bacillota bacterium]|nr:hypothetical protein [Bacillota bacterium]MDP4159612.1 hypothetical protein [Bacillota bacterium]
MKNFKKLIAAATIVISLGVTGAVYAASTTSPADIVSNLTGKSAEEITEQRAAGKTYGAIAQESGKLDEFKNQLLEQKKLVLNQRVNDGYLTQAQADQIYNSLKANQATCDGTGTGRTGLGKGTGIGYGHGVGMGVGSGRGTGQRNGGCTYRN